MERLSTPNLLKYTEAANIFAQADALLMQRRNQIFTLIDVEAFQNKEYETTELIIRTLEVLPPAVRILFKPLEEYTREVQVNILITTAHRQECATKRAADIAEIERYDALFPRDPTFMFESAVVYQTDIVLFANRPLPAGTGFRIQQALALFCLQVHQHCCLDPPSDKPADEPVYLETDFGRLLCIRHPFGSTNPRYHGPTAQGKHLIPRHKH